jgi:hypothetical protein
MRILRRTGLVLVVLLTAVAGAGAQKIPPQKPKLIVGITVSGMQYDYLSVYWDKFGEGGFKKMATTGAHCKNARYSYLITDPSAGFASIATGSIPAAHGIVADYWYDRPNNKIVYCIDDPEQTTIEGTYGTGSFSPRAMNSRTLSDELRVKSRFKSRSVGVSMDPMGAIFMSGHTSTGAYWMDPEKGNWITSSYYMDSLPAWVRAFNARKYPDLYLNRKWETLKPIAEYSESMLDNSELETGFNGQITFPYDLERISMRNRNERNYSILMSTPWGNTYTKDMAIAAIVNEGLGKGEATDMIHIGFNATRHLADRYSTWSVEMEDAYLRLDEDLAHLLEFLDSELGMENVLVYLTAENALAVDPQYLAQHRIPSGFFNYRTSISLLRSYLNAVYGQGEWVTFYHAHQVYLNQELIEDSRLSLDEVQNRVARFMVQMGGVSNAIQAHVLQQTHFTDGILQRIQNSYYQKRSGDVIIYLTPGWVERSSLADNSFTEFRYAPHVPLIFYGWKIRRTTVPYRVSPSDIAVTIASFLEISMPENATGEVIQDLAR